MPKNPGGEIRRQLGPVKARLEGTITQAQAVVDGPLLPNLSLEAYEPLRSAAHQLLLKIERHLKSVEEIDKKYIQVLSSLPADDPEQGQYERVAEGEDGYLQLIETAKDAADGLRACITGIERAELRAEKVQQTVNAGGVSANNLMATAPDENATADMAQGNLFTKMPKLSLPTFSGTAADWLEFWGQFNKTVHETNLNAQDKFSYLKRCLTGSAAGVVEGLAITEDNYVTAVELLKTRYGDEEILKAILYSQWGSLTPVTSHVNYYAIQRLTETVQKIVRQLATLNDNCDTNSLAIQQYLTKLPRLVRLELENERERAPHPQNFTMTSLLEAVNKWLHIRLKVFQVPVTSSKDEARTTTHFKSPLQKQEAAQERASASALATNSSTAHGLAPKTPCIYCGEFHYNDRCTKFCTQQERKQKLAEQKRCFMCLQTGHGAKICPNKAKISCYHCKKRSSHTRSLCPAKFGATSDFARSSTSSTNSSANPTFSSLASNNLTLLAPDEYAMFQTATTIVRKPGSNVMVPCRLLLDSASNRTYMLSGLAVKLKLDLAKNMDLSVKTFGSGEETVSLNTQLATVEVFLKDGTPKQLTVNVADNITGSMSREKLSQADAEFLQKYPQEAFADTLPMKADIICPDILVGQAYFWDFVQSGTSQVKLPSGLRVVPTTLGLMLGGSAPLRFSADSGTPAQSFLSLAQRSPGLLLNSDAAAEIRHEETVKKDFWSLETVGITESPVADESELAMKRFQDNIVLEDDRYQVCWPWKSPRPQLPDNYGLAHGRLRSLSHRLAADPTLLEQYSEIINDQLDKGIVEHASPKSETGSLQHYLPHHPVVKETSNTTKVHIVFDVSAKVHKNANSLNDCLLSGPNLIADLCGILLRFRLPKIAVLADIEKAFLNVGLQMPDRDVCRFLWFSDPTKPTVNNNLVIYRFKRVPFGVISSPFLLEAVLNYHLQQKDADLNKEIMANTYVDNIFLSADSVEEAYEKYKQSKSYLAEVSLNLREWVSNNKGFLVKLPDVDTVKESKVKVLGMIWHLHEDTLALQSTETVCCPEDLTKRKLLQMIASIFDPLGLWTPSTHYGKVLFQKTWSENVGWDEPLPNEFQLRWSVALNRMKQMHSPIPRRVEASSWKKSNAQDDPCCRFQLVGFSEASMVAYGTTVYLVTSTSTEIQSELVFGKMRLTPIGKKKKPAEQISLPRLELLGALIGVRCLKFVSSQLKLPLDGMMLFSDSQCVLHWIHSSKSLKPFVQNRVNEIRQLENVRFQYVPTGENPADLLTRGLASDRLICCELWWNGPTWLRLKQSEWPQIDLPEIPSGQAEMFKEEFTKDARTLKSSAESVSPLPLGMQTERFSSFNKLLQTTVIALRFLKKLSKNLELRNDSVLQKIQVPGKKSAAEMAEAENLWILKVQQKCYPETLQSLRENKECILQKKLGLYLDQGGLIRCAGRFMLPVGLNQDSLPLLLPKDEHFSKLLVEKIHLKVLHGRVNHTLAELRKKFWVPQGRQFVRKVLNQCGICKRFGAGPFQLPQFGPLTKERVEPYTPPFSFTGIDYFGPIYTKGEVNNLKVWVCLFTCLVVRAVHMEVVYDMTTSEFLAAFQRFCCAQAKTPRKIISDNAAQFKLADLVLQLLWNKLPTDTEIAQELADKRITWTFIPALSPWQGGTYERMVGTIKSALRKSLGRKLLKPHQLVNVLCQIAHMVNSRPLTYLSAELDDVRTICPNDFLHPGHDLSLPQFLTTGTPNEKDPDYIPKDTSVSKVVCSWKKLQAILDEFWLLWQGHYLKSLHERQDYKHPAGKLSQPRCPKVGEIVLLKEEGVPRGFWKLAKIIKINPSRDKEVRSVQVMTPSHKILTRPLNLLYPLEILSDESENEETNGNKQPLPEEVVRRTMPPRRAAENFRRKLQKRIKDDALVTVSLGSVVSVTHEQQNIFNTKHATYLSGF